MAVPKWQRFDQNRELQGMQGIFDGYPGVGSSLVKSMSDNNLELVNAFPAGIRDDAMKVVSALPNSSHRAHSFSVMIGEEMVSIPYRIYHDPAQIDSTDLSRTQHNLLACLLTRHHSGFTREENLTTILGSIYNWVPPFIVQLLGEYVIEILGTIRDNLDLLDAKIYGEFLIHNPAFYRKTKERVQSYWNCYYRGENKKDYAGFQIMEFFDRLNAQYKTPKPVPPTIYEDALVRQDLFRWFGVVEAEFERWLAALPLRVHPGLVSFWRRTGGGNLFESETLLGPLASDEGDNVLKQNEFHWNKGLPREFLIFHAGLCLSASSVDRGRHRNRLITVNPETYQIEHRFDTFNEWYQETIRSEYAERYGLPTSPPAPGPSL